MKIIKKYRRSNNHAVSAVIGVTLMVAVTIAMGAVAYAYFTGLIGGSPEINAIISISQSTPSDVSISVIGIQNGPVKSASVIIQLLNQTSGIPDSDCTGTLIAAGENIAVGDVITASGAHIRTTYNVQLLYKGTIVGSCTYIKP